MDLLTFSSHVWILFVCVFVDPLLGCEIPLEWHGEWFQSGLGDVTITSQKISPHMGRCHASDGHNYLLRKRDRNCFMCAVFTWQHENILQYKLSNCHAEGSLADICSEITGDFALYTMVRVRNTPVACPFQGPYTFTYSTGGDNYVCDNPMSEIIACADESRFKFRYKKCHNMYDTHNKEVDMQCLATWDNGDDYLYAKRTGHTIGMKSEMYRCFMHDFRGIPAYMSMSADPSCMGLHSPESGFNTITLYKSDPEKWPAPMCSYPGFFTKHEKWRDLSGKYKIEVKSQGKVFKLRTNTYTEGLFSYGGDVSETLYSFKCMDHIKDLESSSQKFDYKTFSTNDSCTSHYQCVRLQKRSPHVLELYIGSRLRNRNALCTRHHFVNSTRYVFIPSDTEPTPCPFPGSYSFSDTVSGCWGTYKIGCGNRNEMEIETTCSDNKQTVEVLRCLRVWDEHRNSHVIVEKPGDINMMGTCMTFIEDPAYLEISTQQECNFMLPQILGKRITYRLPRPPDQCKLDPRRYSTGDNSPDPGPSRVDEETGNVYSDNYHHDDGRLINSSSRTLTPLGITVSLLLCLLSLIWRR